MDHTQELKHLSLCTGYGGIDIGLSRALSGALRTIAYVEIEAFAIENLVSKIERVLLDVAPIFSDLKRFPWELYRGKVDIVSGGFPCQPFSSAGRRAGDEDPRHLFPYILDGLVELGRPPFVFLENVEGIISSKLKGDGWSDPAGTSVLCHVLRELERVGYDATAGVFSAREIGAPHQRKRVFILGRRSDLSESGRAFVSGLLELERGEELEYTESRYRPRWGGEPELERIQVQAREPNTAPETMGHTESREGRQRGSRAMDPSQPNKQRENGLPPTASSRDRGTAYPAPRGRDQYSWEPPRVTVGDAKHTRPPRAEERGGIETTGDHRRQEGSTGAEQPSRAGESASGRHLSNCSEGEYVTMDHTDEPGLRRDVSSELPRGADMEDAPSSRLQGSAGQSIQGRGARLTGTSTAEASELPRGPDQRDTLPSPRSGAHGNVQGQAQPAMGGDIDGTAGWMDYAQLCRSVDNRTDELRLLGNGVVPDTASRAFRVLWGQLTNEQ